MIRYTLRCDRGHGFESWFQSSNAYDSQVKRKLVSCPNCGSVKVEKAIMAPQIGKKGRAAAADTEAAVPPTATEVSSGASTPLMMAQEAELRAKLKELRDHVTKNADIEHRPIYGEASPDEARSLIDEGIEVSPLPILPGDRN